MVVDAVKDLGGATTNGAVRDWILARYPGTHRGTIQCTIAVLTVNHESRIHWPEGAKPRVADPKNLYDQLFRPARGQVVLYDPAKHGRWAIIQRDDGKLTVEQIRETISGHPMDFPLAEILPVREGGHIATDSKSDGDTLACFAAESHLRDYLALQLEDIEDGLQLYVDESGTTGVEYSTPIGRIDILAIDRDGCFVVIELKVGRGPDAVVGQVLRYVNWVRKHMADGKRVRGFIVAQAISDKIRYALASDPDVRALEYGLRLTIRPCALI